jgi:hypothetical protein
MKCTNFDTFQNVPSIWYIESLSMFGTCTSKCVSVLQFLDRDSRPRPPKKDCSVAGYTFDLVSLVGDPVLRNTLGSVYAFGLFLRTRFKLRHIFACFCSMYDTNFWSVPCSSVHFHLHGCRITLAKHKLADCFKAGSLLHLFIDLEKRGNKILRKSVHLQRTTIRCITARVVVFIVILGVGEAGSTWYLDHYWAYCISPRWENRWNDWLEKPKHSEEICLSAILSTQISTFPDLGSNRDAEVGSQRLTSWSVARSVPEI